MHLLLSHISRKVDDITFGSIQTVSRSLKRDRLVCLSSRYTNSWIQTSETVLGVKMQAWSNDHDLKSVYVR